MSVRTVRSTVSCVSPATGEAPLVAIACGGTGGHLFPGLAVGLELLARGAQVLLLVSEKQVDQQAIRSAPQFRWVTLPAVGLSGGGLWRFVVGLARSWRKTRRLFRQPRPQAVLSMGGFTGAAPVLAGKACGAKVFVHESNAVPGRANRWLARWVDGAFVAFPSAAARLRCGRVWTTGTPVRPQFRPTDPASCRRALGLEPHRPTLLVMGGSQGAHRINELVVEALPTLLAAQADLQCVHLTGPADADWVRAAYRERGVPAVVRAFLAEMELALGAATVAVSRAGGSSLAELAAMQVPAVLIPYPHAADNHQWVNARTLAEAGAAVVLEQAGATGAGLAAEVLSLMQQPLARETMRQRLSHWHRPDAAAQIAEVIVGPRRHAEPEPCLACTVP